MNPTQGTERNRAELFNRLPSVNEVLLAPEVQSLVEAYGHDRVVAAIREKLVEIRAEISADQISETELNSAVEVIAAAVVENLRRGPEYSLKPVINATGVVLHTNLGRAPLSDTALKHVMEVARDYCNLEFDLDSGERSKRAQGCFF